MFLSVPIRNTSYPECQLGETVLYNLEQFKTIGIKYLSNSQDYAVIGRTISGHKKYNDEAYEIVLNVYDTLEEAVSACNIIRTRLQDTHELIHIGGGHSQRIYIDPCYEENLPFS